MINMYSGNSVIANLLMRFPVLIPIAVGSAIAVAAVKVVVPSLTAPVVKVQVAPAPTKSLVVKQEK